MQSDSIIAKRENGRMVIRQGALRLRWDLTDLITSDGYSVRTSFSSSINPLQDATEQKMLEEAFFRTGSMVTLDDVTAYFAQPLVSAARLFAGSMAVESLLAEAGRSSLTSKLTEAGRAVAFGCGLELLPPFELDLDSPSLRRQRQEERRLSEQSQRMGRAAELFKQFRELRAAAPELSAS